MVPKPANFMIWYTEFCVKKAKEKGFLHIIHSWKDPFGLTGPSNRHRICVHNTRELKISELMLIFLTHANTCELSRTISNSC